MPHSSGGGSHGGGSHHSSSGSRSSGGSSYSSLPSEKRISTKPYRDARRFVYYTSSGRSYTYYHTGYHAKANIGKTIGLIIALFFFAFPFSLITCGDAIFIPEPVDLNSYDASIVISDSLNIVDVQQVEAAFVKFQQLTGVTPSLEVIYDTEWQQDYRSLEKYAYSEYLNLFQDEKHWLFVISYPENSQSAEFIAWSWEGMIGDDVGQVINEEAEDRCTELMQKHLLRADAEDVDQAVILAINEFSQTVMDRKVNYHELVFGGIILLVYLAAVYLLIRDHVRHKRMETAIPVPKTSVEMHCEYCGMRYYSDTVHYCPSCGAPIPSEIEKSPKNTRKTIDAERQGE